jgi:hypothetical protein
MGSDDRGRSGVDGSHSPMGHRVPGAVASPSKEGYEQVGGSGPAVTDANGDVDLRDETGRVVEIAPSDHSRKR